MLAYDFKTSFRSLPDLVSKEIKSIDFNTE